MNRCKWVNIDNELYVKYHDDVWGVECHDDTMLFKYLVLEMFQAGLNWETIINKEKYIPYYSDIWSLGILLYVMLFGKFPFKSDNEDKLFELINKAELFFPEDIEVSSEAKDLLKKIIVIKPNERISLKN